MTINKVLLSYARNNSILYLPVFQEAIKAALQADGQTCYWDGDYCSWKSSRFPQVSTFMERGGDSWGHFCPGLQVTAHSLTLFPLGPTGPSGPTGPRSPFRPWGTEQYITSFCLKTMQDVKGLYSFLPLHFRRLQGNGVPSPTHPPPK